MTAELRCDSKLHGVLVDEGYIEVKCSSRFCGADKGTVVLHRFSVYDGTIVTTLRFKEPSRSGSIPGKEAAKDGTRTDSTSVRSA